MSIRHGKTWLIVSAGVVAVALALIGTAWLAPYYLAESRVKAEIGRIRASGEPVSLADMATSEIPDSENAATFYNNAFIMMSGPQAEKDNRLFVSLLSPTKLKADPTLWAEARKASMRYSAVIPLVVKGASKPRCNFRISYWKRGKDEVRYPTSLKRLQGFVLACALLEAKDGRADKALRLVQTSLSLSETLKAEPTLIFYHIRLSMVGRTCAMLQDVMAAGRPTDKQMQEMYDALSRIDLRPGYILALNSERAHGIESYNFFAAFLSGGRTPLSTLLFSWERMKLCADELYYLQYMKAAIDATADPYPYLHKKRITMPKKPAYVEYADFLLPVFARAWHKCKEGNAELSGSLVFLALEAYKTRFGAYPESLNQCRKKLGWKMPEDPFTRKDLIYRQEGKGFLLYSIGANLKDDGGKAFSERTSNSDEDYDIVWRMNQWKPNSFR